MSPFLYPEGWLSLLLCCPLPPGSPFPLPAHPGKQNNKAGDDDDDDNNYLGMEKPTHLLVHHTVCTVILNRDQRETTGD